MTKWMTSGAQRLKSNLNRSFCARKNKKASSATVKHSNRSIVAARPPKAKVGATKDSRFLNGKSSRGCTSGRLTASNPPLAYEDSYKSERKQSNNNEQSSVQEDVSLPDSFDIERMISLQEQRQHLAVQERMIQHRKVELEEEEDIMKQQHLGFGSFQLEQMPSKGWMTCANDVQNVQETRTQSGLVGVNAMNEQLMGQCENAILPRTSERKSGTAGGGLQRFQHQDGAYDMNRSTAVDGSSSSSSETGFKQGDDVAQDSKSTLHPPIRYFNNGVEVLESGIPLSNRLQSASNTIFNNNVQQMPPSSNKADMSTQHTMKKGMAQHAKDEQKMPVENGMQLVKSKKKEAKRPTKKRKRAPNKLVNESTNTNTTVEKKVTSETRNTSSSSPMLLLPKTGPLSVNDHKNTVGNLGGPHGDVLNKLFGPP